MAKESERYKDIRKLEKTFNNLDGDRKTIGLSLIDELYFMGDTLSKLKKIIDKDGVVENFEQGVQKFIREHPALKSYNSLIKNYQSMMKQLNEMIPNNSSLGAGDKLGNFMASDD